MAKLISRIEEGAPSKALSAATFALQHLAKFEKIMLVKNREDPGEYDHWIRLVGTFKDELAEMVDVLRDEDDGVE